MSRRIGGDVRASLPLSENWTASASYTLMRNEIYNVGPAASLAIKQAVPGYPTATSGTYYSSAVGYGLTYDGRDAPKNTTSGLYFTSRQEVAGLGGDVQSLKTTADLKGYYPIADGVTLVGRMTGGAISGYGGQDVRLLDLFYVGGETVRGFAASGIGPRDLGSANLDALGGKYYFATSAELRFPIPYAPDNLGVRGTVFADAGSLWGATQLAKSVPGLAGDAASVRASTGVGLIWDSPIGALGVSYAVPLLKQSFDKLQPFSVGITP